MVVRRLGEPRLLSWPRCDSGVLLRNQRNEWRFIIWKDENGENEERKKKEDAMWKTDNCAWQVDLEQGGLLIDSHVMWVCRMRRSGELRHFYLFFWNYLYSVDKEDYCLYHMWWLGFVLLWNSCQSQCWSLPFFPDPIPMHIHKYNLEVMDIHKCILWLRDNLVN